MRIDPYNIDTSLAAMLAPALEQHQMHRQCTIPDSDMDEMIWAFKFAANEYISAEANTLYEKFLDSMQHKDREAWVTQSRADMRRFNEGLGLFSDYFRDLWL